MAAEGGCHVVLVAAGLAGLAVRGLRLVAVAATLAAVNVAILGIPVTPHATAASGPVSGRLRVLAANVEIGNTDFAAVESGTGLVASTPTRARGSDDHQPIGGACIPVTKLVGIWA